MNRKKAYLRLLLFILVLIMITLVSCQNYFTHERLYFIPQINMYIKVIMPRMKDYGYIIFSKDSVISLSKNVDYIKVDRNCELELNIYFNQEMKNEFVLFDPWKYCRTINAVKYKFRIIKTYDDSTFFEQKNDTETGPVYYITKKHYTCILLNDYPNSLWVAEYGKDEYSVEVHPIKR